MKRVYSKAPREQQVGYCRAIQRRFSFGSRRFWLAWVMIFVSCGGGERVATPEQACEYACACDPESSACDPSCVETFTMLARNAPDCAEFQFGFFDCFSRAGTCHEDFGSGSLDQLDSEVACCLADLADEGFSFVDCGGGSPPDYRGACEG